MNYQYDIQKVNLSAWKLPIGETGRSSNPIIVTEILLAQLTFLLSTNYQDFSNQKITCNKEKNRCLIISPNVAEELFWDPREQCFGSTMRNDIITGITSENTGFRRGQTLYDREPVDKPLRFRTSKDFHDCNPYIPKSIEGMKEDLGVYKGIKSTISFPLYEITTPFGKMKGKYFGLPYLSNTIFNQRLSQIIDKTIKDSSLSKCNSSGPFRKDCCINVNTTTFHLDYGICSQTVCHCPLAHNYGILERIESIQSLVDAIHSEISCLEFHSILKKFNRVMIEEFSFLGIATDKPRLENVAIGLGMSDLKNVLDTTQKQLSDFIILTKCKQTDIATKIYQGIPYVTSSITLTLMGYLLLQMIYKRLCPKKEIKKEEDPISFPLIRT